MPWLQHAFCLPDISLPGKLKGVIICVISFGALAAMIHKYAQIYEHKRHAAQGFTRQESWSQHPPLGTSNFKKEDEESQGGKMPCNKKEAF